MSTSKPVHLAKVEEVAACLNVPTSWVYKQAAQGTLPVVRVGRYLRFDLEKVLAALQAGPCD